MFLCPKCNYSYMISKNKNMWRYYENTKNILKADLFLSFLLLFSIFIIININYLTNKLYYLQWKQMIVK